LKICTQCKTKKEFTEFYKNNRSTDKLTYQCKACIKSNEFKSYQKNPWRKRLYNFNYAWGTELTQEEHKKLLESQKGKCGICQDQMTKPYIDHDHKTKQVRKLLCHRCNTLLGMAKDRTDILQLAISYLNNHQ
jgi:hypothetical protein